MYLKELRIQGFKSFADPTQLHLQPGVTAIVGPNGCGKSNIADAIRWVLGEQSSKSLRAGAMQDVIFQGTNARKPLNLCEVVLLFTDCEAQLGVGFSEVEITRRVTREGGSDYFINGKSSRLKDIQRLFLDTGVGQVSYSFMLQGQIDQVLSSNPAERRAIFEEAAGISRYKAQRREALGRLEGVEANLARVGDVMDEVGRRIGSLRRQAAKALRYKRVKERLTHMERAHAARRFARLTQEEVESSARAEGLRTQVLTGRAQLDEAQQKLASRRLEREALAAQLQSAQQSVYDLRSARDQAAARAASAATRAKDHGERAAALRREIEAVAREHQELLARAATNRKALEDERQVAAGAQDAFDERQNAVAAAQQRLAQAETQLSRARQALIARESGLGRLRANCTSIEVDLKTFEGRHASLADDLRQAGAELEVLRSQSAELAREREVRVERRQAGEQQLAATRAEVEQRIAAFRAAQAAVTQTDRDLATLIARLGLLEELQRKMEGFSDGAKALLRGKLADSVPPERLSLIMAQLEVDEEWAPVAELLLGPAVDAIALSSPDDLLPLLKGLESRRLGRACLMLPGGAMANGVPAAGEGIVAALSVVRAKDPAFSPLVQRLFEGCCFADTLETVLRCLAGEPGWRFRQVATRDGCVIDQRGIVFGGQGGARQDSFLRRDAQIRQLRKEQSLLEERLRSGREQCNGMQAALRETEEAVELMRRHVNEAAQELAALQGQERAAAQRIEQASKRLEQRRRELDTLDASRADSERRLEKARGELESAEADLGRLRSGAVAAEEAVVTARGEREACREGFDDLRLEVASKRQRMETLQGAIVELDRRSRDLAAQTERRQREAAALDQQLSGLGDEAREQRELAATYEAELAAAQQVLDTRRESLAATDREIQGVDASLKGLRSDVDVRTAELSKAEVQLARQRSELEFLAAEARKEHNADIASFDWRRELLLAGDPIPERVKVDLDDEEPVETAQVVPPPPTRADLEHIAAATHWPDIEAELAALSARIEAMGPVNLVAIEEYKELRERHAFLKAQSDDLWNAKDQLIGAIEEINRTSSELFRNTFDQVRTHFRETFQTLFGGGEADLELLDTGDPLEAGIEIVARPPGTRLRSIALLSGGQKTMTAVALLFAIYRVKPSPFCVLDEIDAPLDDANIGRFCAMLERFLEFSQFLIITHNKRTIAAANTIYGVTMQERGVSRILSMRYNRNEQKLETTPVVADATTG